MDDASDAALIAIDWGTTAARAYRVDAAGTVIGSRSAELGVQRVTDGNFPRALDALLGDWGREALPRIACGMIGSRQGWIEAPYVICPAGLDAFGKRLVRTPAGELVIVPGAICRDAGGVPDVMRGEETQLIGAGAPDESRMLAVLPGTHSKWAVVEQGRLSAFATYMTGELFAVLLDHSILGRMADRATPEPESPSVGPGGLSAADSAFVAGLERGLEAAALAHDIFGARTLALTGELDAMRIPDWLSGVLIGHEIAEARRWAQALGAPVARVRVIGSAALARRYVLALAHAGIATECASVDAAARGLWRIARQAGLVH